jgi:hypothetical protein
MLTLKDRAYTPGVYSSLLGWEYQRRINGFAWRMFKESCAIFDEECGELSFSLLGRLQLASSGKASIAQVNRAYADLRTYVAASRDMRLTKHLSDFHLGGRHTIKNQNQAVAATVQHFKAVIRALKTNNHTAYDGEKPGYRSKMAATSHQTALCDNVKFLGNPIDLHWMRQRAREKAHGKYEKAWVYQFQAVWPKAFNPIDEPHDEKDHSVDDAPGSPGSPAVPAAEDSDSPDFPEEKSEPEPWSDSDDAPLCRLRRPRNLEDEGDEGDNKHSEGEDEEEETGKHGKDERSESDNPENQEDDQDTSTDDNLEDELPRNLSHQQRLHRDVNIEDKEARIRTYEALSQRDREAVYTSYTSIDKSNVLSGKRNRTSRRRPEDDG